MLSTLAFLAFVPCLFGTSSAQGLQSNIAPEEADVLSCVIGDFAGWRSPEHDPLVYRNPLPIPPVKQPKMAITNPVTGKDIWYYEMEIRPFEQQIFPNLGPARLVGYDGISPGPTVVIPRGTESVIRFMNNGNAASAVHLHGSPSRAPFDGWGEDLIEPGEYKDYYYPNTASARLLWYHDHAKGISAENAHFGQAGAYIVTDPAEDSLGLPSGYGAYDIPLILSSKYYGGNGTLKSVQNEIDNSWGDIIHVNGQPWPFLNVEPRKYRLRFLNAALSRSFVLYFATAANPKDALPFQVIASDTGLLEHPVEISQVLVSTAERYDVVFDFVAYADQVIELRNHGKSGGEGVGTDYEHTDKVMRFMVSPDAVDDPSTVPARLREVPYAPSTAGVNHKFRFHREKSEWRINGTGFKDAAGRVLRSVPRGTIERWELENATPSFSHPVHVHLVEFRVVERHGPRSRSRGVRPYEAAGLKDVVWLGSHEVVVVEAHYQPWAGLYMFHCHNFIHEDHDMMAAFNITALAGLGYDETTDFADPVDPRWNARPYRRDDLTTRAGIFADDAITEVVQALARQQPYSERSQVESALKDYWAAHRAENTSIPAEHRGENANAPAGPVPWYRRFLI